MLSLLLPVRIFLCTQPAYMRRSFDGLAQMVREFLGADPLSGHLFVFRNKKGDRVKLLYWDTAPSASGSQRLRVPAGRARSPIGLASGPTGGIAATPLARGPCRQTVGEVRKRQQIEVPIRNPHPAPLTPEPLACPMGVLHRAKRHGCGTCEVSACGECRSETARRRRPRRVVRGNADSSTEEATKEAALLTRLAVSRTIWENPGVPQ